MARARSTDPARRRLLSLWEAPPDAGEPIGVLATTFTLDTALFEEECLARFAGVQSDPDRDGALYRIEREEKLAKVLAATVVADVHNCSGQRSLRWDLLAARPKTGVMHAKISLLAWRRQVRAIIGSANLTDSGYRSNQECFATLEFTLEEADRGLLDPLLTFLRDILALTPEGAGRSRAERLIAWVDEAMPQSTASARGLQRRLVLIGPGRPSLFEQVAGFMPPNSRADKAHVVSPFFDKKLSDHGPERTLWSDLLRQRGGAEAHFHVAGEQSPETNVWRLEAPAHLQEATPSGRREVLTQLHAIPVFAVPTESGPENRPLHAKSLRLEHENWMLLCVGSSNFTSAGTGLQPKARNYEANVAYVLREDARDATRKALHARALAGGDGIDLEGTVQFEPALDAEGEAEDPLPPLPAFFDEALLLGTGPDGYRLRLRFLPESPPGQDWRVLVDQALLIDSTGWQSRGAPASLELTTVADRQPPSVLTVFWGGTHKADWPVNAESAAALPMPTELQGLSLAALLDLLSSARPLSEALRLWLRRQPSDDDDVSDVGDELVDPHAKVDTSGFLMKRMQRACWAIGELAKRLAEPALSSAAMAWRLHGPVGAQAVLEAMRKQCDPALPDEWAFLLCELLGELNRVKPTGLANEAGREEATAMLQEFTSSVHRLLEEAKPKCSKGVRKYISDATLERAGGND